MSDIASSNQSLDKIYFYIILDDNFIVRGHQESPLFPIDPLPPNMHEVPESGDAHIGKQFDSETGEYTRMSNYAIFADNHIIDIVTQKSDDPVPFSAMMIPSADRSLIGCKCINGQIIIPDPVNERLDAIEAKLSQVIGLLSDGVMHNTAM